MNAVGGSTRLMTVAFHNINTGCMPESKTRARERAKRLHIPQSHVVKGERGWYIAPRNLHKKHDYEVYAALRSEGYPKGRAAAIAYSQAHK